MENIKDDYLIMIEVYHDLNESLIPHINEEKPIFKFKIDEIINFAKSLLKTIERRAHNVYDMLPRETRRILNEKDKQIRAVVNDKYEITGYYTKNLLYLQYESLLDVCFLNICKIDSNADDTIKLSSKKDYSLFPIAYKKLNDALFLHINGTQYLSENEIIRIVIFINYILTTLLKNAYESCEALKDINWHKEIEDYFNAPISINEGCSLSESDITLLKEHNEWKVKRVKHLQELFPTKRDRFPHDEMYFVKRGIMYNENF